MNRISRLAILAAMIAPALAGCGTPAGRYFHNRALDLSDTLNMSLVTPSYGVMANAGPVVVGFETVEWSSVPGRRMAVGLGGPLPVAPLSRSVAGLGFPISFFRVGAEKPAGVSRLVTVPSSEGLERHPPYMRLDPPWGSVGVDIGIGYAIGVRVDAVQLLDLLIGLTTVDILGDDAPPVGADVTATPTR